jgi:hypothetical protein
MPLSSTIAKITSASNGNGSLRSYSQTISEMAAATSSKIIRTS